MRRGGGIRLHPEHGVNPTIPLCWWCGKEKNEVALLGAAYRGEAPRNLVIDYAPCDECAAYQAKGITLIEVVSKPNAYGGSTQPERTGRWCVITRDGAARMFNVDLTSKPMAYVEQEAWNQIGLSPPTTEGGGDGEETTQG